MGRLLKGDVVKTKHIAWSYSRWKDYCKCPKFFDFKHIQKLPEPGNQYMERGSKIHTLAETYLNGKGKTVPQDLKRVELELKLLRKIKAVPEDQWCFTHNFEGVTEWFAPDAWARVKIDAVANLTQKQLPLIRELERRPSKATTGVWVVDWKTGQFRPEASVDQLELYALSIFLLRPQVSFALATLTYTDVGRNVHAFYEATARDTLKKLWLKRVEPLQKDRKFKATPGTVCNYCFYSKKKGGPCRAG